MKGEMTCTTELGKLKLTCQIVEQQYHRLLHFKLRFRINAGKDSRVPQGGGEGG